MEPAVPIPPSTLRVAGDLDWARTDVARIVHVGQSCIVLEAVADDPALIPVTFGDRGLTPGGLHVPLHDDVVRVRAHLAAPGHGTFTLRGWQSIPGRRDVDLRIRPSLISPLAVAALAAHLAHVPRVLVRGAAMDPTRQRAAGPVLARGAVSGSVALGHVLDDIVGAGPGATPAGDDVVVGVLAALDLAAVNGLLAPEAIDRLGHLRDEVLTRTVRTARASGHDLAAAARGSYCERVLGLIEALADPIGAATAVAAARTWGATSGLDLLHGVLAGAAAALSSSTTRLSAAS